MTRGNAVLFAGQAASAIALVLAAHGAAALEPDKLYEKVGPSVFVVRALAAGTGNYELGSAVVVAPGKAVTSCHVIENADRIRLERGSSKFDATVEFADPQRDLCQLAVKDLTAPPVALAQASTARIGQRVFAIGAPQGTTLALADGMISSMYLLEGSAPAMKISSPIEAGSSGGGLFDGDGNLLGVLTSGYGQSEATNTSFVLPADWVRELPDRARASQEKARLAAVAAASAAAGARKGHVGELAIGDSWTYTLIDMQYKPRDRSRKFVHTVRSVDEKSVTEQILLKDAVVSEFAYSNESVALLRGGTIEISPFLPLLHPLKQGEMLGAARIDGPDVKSAANIVGGRPWIVEGGRVVGTEKVTVPAGSFDCLKVTFNGRVHTEALSTMLRGTGSYQAFSQTVWYAPKVKRAAKVLTSGPGILDSYELESYSLK